MNSMEKELNKIYEDSNIEETLNQYLEIMKMQEGDNFSGAQGNFYMIDPFAIMYFTADGKSIHPSVDIYCKEALNFWESVKAKYGHLYFIPPYIRETAQCNKFVRITRDFIKNHKEIPNSANAIKFYELEDDPKSSRIDDKVYEDLGKVYQLNNKVKDEKNGAFGPASWNNQSTGMNPAKKPNVKLASPSATIDWGSHGENAYNILIRMAKDLENKKDKLVHEEKGNYALQYMYLMVKYIYNNKEEALGIVSDIKSYKNNKSGSKKGNNAKKLPPYYRNTNLKVQPKNGEYWKDTIIGDIGELDKIANGDDENWQKTLKDLKGVFDRDTVNADTEKVYNVKHLPKDLLGLADDDPRYDARVYEDPLRKKVKGVAGHDIFKLDQKLSKLADEIADIDEELVNTTPSSDEAKELLKKKMDLQKSYDNLKDKLDAAEEEGQSEHHNKVNDEIAKNFSDVNFNSEDKLKDVKPEKIYSYILESPDFDILRRSIMFI